MLRRSINIRADTRDRRVATCDAGDAEVGDLYRFAVLCQQQILRLDIAVNNAVAMRVAKPGTDLFEILQSGLERQPLFAARFLQIAAFKIFKHKIMKDGAPQIAGRAMADAADDVRVTNAVESDRLVLKVLDKRPFEIGSRSS